MSVFKAIDSSLWITSLLTRRQQNTSCYVFGIFVPLWRPIPLFIGCLVSTNNVVSNIWLMEIREVPYWKKSCKRKWVRGQMFNSEQWLQCVCVCVCTRGSSHPGKNNSMCRYWLCNVYFLQKPYYFKKCVYPRCKDLGYLYILTGAIFYGIFIYVCWGFFLMEPSLDATLCPNTSTILPLTTNSCSSFRLRGYLLQGLLRAPSSLTVWGGRPSSGFSMGHTCLVLALALPTSTLISWFAHNMQPDVQSMCAG